MTYAEEYQTLFSSFVEMHNLDLDDQFWPLEKKLEWKNRFETFQKAWDRKLSP